MQYLNPTIQYYNQRLHYLDQKQQHFTFEVQETINHRMNCSFDGLFMFSKMMD